MHKEITQDNLDSMRGKLQMWLQGMESPRQSRSTEEQHRMQKKLRSVLYWFDRIMHIPVQVWQRMWVIREARRKFLEYGISDAEATTIITQGVDFGLTQLVDCNFGVHAAEC